MSTWCKASSWGVPSDQMSNWTKVWPNVNLTWRSIWEGCIWPPQSLTKCQPNAMSHPGGTSDQMSTWPKVWPNVNLTWGLILGVIPDYLNTLWSFALASQRSFLMKDQQIIHTQLYHHSLKHRPICNKTGYPISALLKLAQEAMSQSAQHISSHTHITLVSTFSSHLVPYSTINHYTHHTPWDIHCSNILDIVKLNKE